MCVCVVCVWHSIQKVPSTNDDAVLGNRPPSNNGLVRHSREYRRRISTTPLRRLENALAHVVVVIVLLVDNDDVEILHRIERTITPRTWARVKGGGGKRERKWRTIAAIRRPNNFPNESQYIMKLVTGNPRDLISLITSFFWLYHSLTFSFFLSFVSFHFRQPTACWRL